MALQNRLILAMPPEVRGLVDRHMERMDLAHGLVLHRPGETIRDIYFPLDCLISVTVAMFDGHTSEVGVVGSREMVGVNAFMGGRETTQTTYIIQVAGSAIRMPTEPFLEAFDREKGMRDVMLRYTQAFIAQISQNVACNRQHDMIRRLARWLLESRDRLQTENLCLSHEFMGQMLGTSRPVVGETVGRLKDMGLIETGRRSIRIVDSAGLEAASCECYSVVRDEYNRLLGHSDGGGEWPH